MKYSVIIPTLNTEESIIRLIFSVRSALSDPEIIIVDGGSSDKTVYLAEPFVDKVVESPKGRGIQMNRGARLASGDIFIFLHADTILPLKAQEILDDHFKNPEVLVGTFAMRFDKRHWLLELYGRCTIIDSLWTRFGDQCIVARRDFFQRLGGFPNWPLFEDVRFLQEARRETRINTFPGIVVTSAAKFIKNGIISQQIKNGWLIILYLLGVSPNVLSEKYSS